MNEQEFEPVLRLAREAETLRLARVEATRVPGHRPAARVWRPVAVLLGAAVVMVSLTPSFATTDPRPSAHPQAAVTATVAPGPPPFVCCVVAAPVILPPAETPKPTKPVVVPARRLKPPTALTASATPTVRLAPVAVPSPSASASASASPSPSPTSTHTVSPSPSPSADHGCALPPP